MEDRQEIEQPKEHAPSECMCVICRPEAFAGRQALVSQPMHMCQHCFTGPCEYPGEETAAPNAEEERA